MFLLDCQKRNGICTKPLLYNVHFAVVELKHLSPKLSAAQHLNCPVPSTHHYASSSPSNDPSMSTITVTRTLGLWGQNLLWSMARRFFSICIISWSYIKGLSLEYMQSGRYAQLNWTNCCTLSKGLWKGKHSSHAE